MDVLPDIPAGVFGQQVRGKKLTLIIGRYTARNYSPTGRGTKGYIAYVVKHKRLVFLKLTWRPDSPDIQDELTTYKQLLAESVPFLPHVLAGGNILRRVKDSKGKVKNVQGRTRSQDFLNIPNLLPRVQYHLVLETVGLPLSKYANSFALVSAVYQAFQGLHLHDEHIAAMTNNMRYSPSSSLYKSQHPSP